MNKPKDVTKKVLLNSKKDVIFKTICSIIYRAIAMITPILFSNAVNEVTVGNYKKAIFIALIAIVAVIIFRMFDIINTYSWHRLYNKMYDNFTKIGIKKAFDNSLYSLSRFNIGEFLNIMSTDINVICDFYCNLIMRIIRIIEVMVIFIYFFMIDFYIGLSGIFIALVSVTVIFLSSKKIERKNKEKLELFDDRNTVINEFLLSMREIKSFNMFTPIKNRIETSNEKYTKAFLKQRVVEDSYKFSVLALIEAFRWCMFIYGIYLITIGNMEMGTLLIIYNYFTQLVEGFNELAVINTGVRQLKVSENRFFQLIIYSKEEVQIDKQYNFKNDDIEFKKILYGNKENPKLKDTSLKIKGNAINSLVGTSESGKSGVVDLLLKLNSQHEGTITIGGCSISDIDFDHYYDLISSIDKNDRFMSISIKDNLNIVCDNLEEIINLCKKLNIHDEIQKQKHGYDTILNGPEDNLKANTKTLLNIARILLKDTKIMIFDEILSSLNEKSKNDVYNILEEMKDNHTIIIVDNDDSSFKVSENIIIFNDGTAIKSGTPEDFKNKNTYAKYL